MLSRPYFTTHEIAELFKISEATVRNRIHDGDLRAVRFGREFRVAAKDLEAFVEAHATRPPEQNE
ncbi:MAG: helix-turn-helix domain-containing protein [Alphaproteobacteria bacterium]|nr:helix-turn-helix domain-containing protein [Alphaproteobacteria bacterium]